MRGSPGSCSGAGSGVVLRGPELAIKILPAAVFVSVKPLRSQQSRGNTYQAVPLPDWNLVPLVLADRR